MDDSVYNEWKRVLSMAADPSLGGLADEGGVPPASDIRKRNFCRSGTHQSLVRDALDHKRGLLAYQPVFSARHRSAPAFYEGLTRIYSREGKLIPAGEFIQEIDCSVAGREIDCLSLALCLQTLHEHPDLRLSVNVSARSIAYPRWGRTLDHWLKEDPYIGERLILEISERSTMLIPELVSVFMHQRKADGICFALDYFGSGAMSFRHICQFGFDIVKFDAEYVRDIAGDANNQIILKALLFVAQSFDMLTVAVSVENEDDAAYLAEMDVDCLQGFHLGAPSVKPPWLRGDMAAAQG